MGDQSVLFLFLFTLLLIEARPRHMKHRHLRHLEPDFCQNRLAHIMIRQDVQCSPIRERRSARMSLESGQASSLCSYKVCEDVDENRIPKRINRVFCLEQGCGCKKIGAFKCTQLIEKMEVWFGKVNQTIEVEHGCVCAAKFSESANIWTGPPRVP